MARANFKQSLYKGKGKSFDYDREAFKAFQDQAPEGRYIFEVAKVKKSKTRKQTETIFGHMIKSTVEQAEEQCIGVDDLLVYLIDGRIPKGVGITKDFLHELMYVICPTTNADGKRVTLSKMDTIQAADLFERFRNTMAGIGIVIADPDPNWKEK